MSAGPHQRVRPVEYLEWAKRHRRCRFELTASGMPPPQPSEFDLRAEPTASTAHAGYGDPVLTELIAERYGASADRVLPTCGASTANFIAMAAVTEPGDRVLIEQPVYEPLSRVAEFLQLQPMAMPRPAENRFAPDLDATAAALRDGVRAVVMSNLHNPSGLLCPDDLLQSLAELCAKHAVTLIVDEVYLDFARLNGSVGQSAVRLGERVVVTSSLTKVYGLGCLRAGWMIAEPHAIARARQVMDHIMVDNPGPSEWAAVRAMRILDRLGERTQQVYQQNYPLLRDWLAGRDDLVSCGNDGAMFEFVRVADVEDTRPLCELLAGEYETQVVPGEFFGAPGHVRIGFAVPGDVLKEGLSRTDQGLHRFRRL
jgi:aspartate/methionine/tyrosine aminotransferase